MEKLVDSDDFIPPTPQAFPSKMLSISSAKRETIVSTKLSRNTKRKKISGASPDMKKFKEKGKQVSLLNYLVKKKTEDISDSKDSRNVLKSAKVNLLAEFKASDICKTPFGSSIIADKGISSLDNASAASVNAPAEEKLSSEPKTSACLGEKDPLCDKRTNNYEINLPKTDDTGICKDIENLKLDLALNHTANYQPQNVACAKPNQAQYKSNSMHHPWKNNDIQQNLEDLSYCTETLNGSFLKQNGITESDGKNEYSQTTCFTDSVPSRNKISNMLVSETNKSSKLENIDSEICHMGHITNGTSCSIKVDESPLQINEIKFVGMKNRPSTIKYCTDNISLKCNIVNKTLNEKFEAKSITNILPSQSEICCSELEIDMPPIDNVTLFNNYNGKKVINIVSNGIPLGINEIEFSEMKEHSPIKHHTDNLSLKYNTVNKELNEKHLAESIATNLPNQSKICSSKMKIGLQPIDNDEFLTNNDVKEKNGSVNHHMSESTVNTSNIKSKQNEHNYHPNDDSGILGQSMSWLNDIDWNSESMIENESYSVDKHTKSENDEYAILYKVIKVERNIPNEIELMLSTGDQGYSNGKTCILKGFWADTLVDVGDSVNVLQNFHNNQAIIDNESGFVVINPNFLLTSTSVVSTLFCMRKAAMNYILPSWSLGNSVMTIGNIVHDLFQQAVNSATSSENEIKGILEKVFKKRHNLISICLQDIDESEIKDKVMSYVPSIANWVQSHCKFSGKCSSNDVLVTNILGIEDNVWCPKYGIKGKIDMTVQACIKNSSNSKIMPLELKTGRSSYSAEHIGQIYLYTLMMEVTNKKVSDGLLLYLKDARNMKLVSANHNSRRGLIQLRNELAHYTHKWVATSHAENQDIEQCQLPQVLNNQKLCQKCPYLLPCTVYQRISSRKELDADHAMNSLVPSATGHLNSAHLEYFAHWSNLLLLESSSTVVTNAFWTVEATKREQKSLCLSWMSIKHIAKNSIDDDRGLIAHTFVRSSKYSPNSEVTSSTNFDNAGLRDGDYVSISNQNNLNEISIAMGYVLKVSSESIDIAAERDLSAFSSYTFRIDKQVSNSAASCIRNNLMLLMADETSSEKLRHLIIEKRKPQFINSLSKNVVLLGRPFLKSLNKVQQRVILKALMAQDYFLIKGMPGTGKTSTIVALVQLLVKMGLSVILTSYTHSAVDNILLKLRDKVQFVRIGQEARMHADIKKYSFENLTKDFSNVEEFRKFMKEQAVVATTSLGVSHAIFKIRKFDICIVDEASQINQIACIGPLFYACKFILVGDDKQLPPLVVSEKARSKGMQESLFEKLWNIDCGMELTIQYRMNEEIMRFCNTLTYNGSLKCGSDDIAKAVLSLEQIEPSTVDWIALALSPDLQKSALFLNTDKIIENSKEEDKSTEHNELEASLAIKLLTTLLKYKIQQSNIGVITPYRQQVDLIKSKIRLLNIHDVEVNTIDQYQGRDKDIIIMSFVKADPSKQCPEKTGVILNDERRLNVAISRSKKKLLVIGSKSSLVQYKPIKDFIMCFQDDQFVELSSSCIHSLNV